MSRAGNRKPQGRSGGFEGLLAWCCPVYQPGPLSAFQEDCPFSPPFIWRLANLGLGRSLQSPPLDTGGRTRSFKDPLSPGILPPLSLALLLAGSCCPAVQPLLFQAGGHEVNSTLALGHPPVSAKPSLSDRYRWPELPFKMLKLSQNSELRLNLSTHSQSRETQS